MAYAATSSALRKTANLLKDSQSSSIQDALICRSEIKSIFQELILLEPILVKYNYMMGSKLRVNFLEEQIEDAVDKYMDVIETYISSDRFLSNSRKNRVHDYALVLSKELKEIQQQLSPLTKKMENKLELYMEEEGKRPGKCFAVDDNVVSSRIYPGGRDGTDFMGLDDELRQLMVRILGNSEKVDVIAIFGMASIGKTTLAQQVYDHPSTLSHFDTRIMVTIGPNFTTREFLLLVLDHIGIDIVERLEKLGDGELRWLLEKYLMGKKWLIVLDDVWRPNILGYLSDLWEEDGNESQIVITTRLLHFCPVKNTHFKRFLNDENSWDLLRRMVFTNPEEHCTYELEKIGKQIAINCEGLPLAIVSVAELLRLNEKTIEFWEIVSNDENPLNIGIDDSTHISKSLHLSYEMLPQQLKACFLYLGVFPKSYKFSFFNLTRLWIAEGFLTPEARTTMEVVSQRTLSKLASDSVVLGQEARSMGGIKTCRVHVVFQNLCINVAQKEEFCHAIKKYAYSFPQGTNRQPRMCIHNNVVLGIEEVRATLESIPSIRSLLCFGPQQMYPLDVDFNFKLLRTLDALRIRFYTFPIQVLHLVRLTYLALTYDGELPNSISKLWKLEVLIVGRHHNIKSFNAPSYLPVEIWDLKWLRHLQCMGTDLPDYCTSNDGCDDYSILKNLITLSGVGHRSCTPRVLVRMHSLEKLGIQIVLLPDEVENFSFFNDVAQQLHQLRSFKCIVSGLNSQIKPTTLVFPYNYGIKKISLSGCRFPWEHMTAIASLRYLEVLKLRCHAFQGSVWETCQGGFRGLKYLLLEDLDIVEWRASHDHFPALERLIIKHCYKLREIPIDVGNIRTLKVIKMEDCSSSLVISAEQIKAYKNGHLDVRISSSMDEDVLRIVKPRSKLAH